ncbi:hypothetical protein PENSPDRAFT_607687 [Peniophora sp. CONT]|nr:hypothetical protein PENSPDRAFT_607687 [Peniophora sp. CONT]
MAAALKSLTLKSSRAPLRIIALPLTSAVHRPGHPSGVPSSVVYYHFQVPPKDPDAKPTWLEWGQNKAVATWAGFGKAAEGSWKVRLHTYGERLVDRIDFEELALTGLDVSMGPQLTGPNPTAQEEEEKKMRIPLVHPTFLGFSTYEHLQNLLSKRTPRHRKGFWTWFFIMPLTAPFAIVPIIPNLPFFYAAWRTWSHYKAWKASEYLESLFKQGLIEDEGNEWLDEAYVAHAPALSDKISPLESLRLETDPMQGGQNDSSAKKLILTEGGVPPIISLFALPDSAAAQLTRAIQQARARLEKGEYK